MTSPERLVVRPAGPIRGEGWVPGDKSLSHRLLILAAMAQGDCELSGLSTSLDVISTASCLAELCPDLRPELQGWNFIHGVPHENRSFTSDRPQPRLPLRVPGKGRRALTAPAGSLDCGNSGTSMRLLMGVLAASPWAARLSGDPSLSKRPLERVAAPLREMGAEILTADGHAPVEVRGGPLSGIDFAPEVASAQVKGAVLLAGLAAEGQTRVLEAVATRDHTERLMAGLGLLAGPDPMVRASEVPPFRAEAPGDVSSAAFLAAAAVLSGGEVLVGGVGLNPTRLAFLDVMTRMGAEVRTTVERSSLGEPIGTFEVRSGGGLSGVEVEATEAAALIDEIPVLAFMAALADGPSRFRGVGELRVKESDRVAGIVGGLRALGGQAETEGDDLLVGGGGLQGGIVDPLGDHRIAMAAAVAGTSCPSGVTVTDAGSVNVSFPGFAQALRHIGADVEG